MLAAREPDSDRLHRFSVNHLVFRLFRFEVRNLKRSHRVQRHEECLTGIAFTVLIAQVLPHLSQNTENPRPIKPLTLTVFAEIHHGICTSDASSSNPQV